MKEPNWLSREVVLTIHQMLLERFGGLDGIRNEGLLDSALGRPLNSFSYESPTLAELAAGYAFGIVRNHPFLDGNKRTGFMAAYTFLGINGLRFEAAEEEAVIFTRDLAAGAIGAEAYADWLGGSVVEVSDT